MTWLLVSGGDSMPDRVTCAPALIVEQHDVAVVCRLRVGGHKVRKGTYRGSFGLELAECLAVTVGEDIEAHTRKMYRRPRVWLRECGDPQAPCFPKLRGSEARG